MNPIANLLNFNKSADSEELTPEEQEAMELEAKKERIEFHRRSVRNGPTKFNFQTTGQRRRQADRDRKTQARKATRRHRREYLRKQQELAVLRGQLQTMRALPASYVPTLAAYGDASVEIIRKFGARGEHGALIVHDGLLDDAIAKALETYEAATA